MPHPACSLALKGIEPVRFTDDATIAIYRTDDLPGIRSRERNPSPPHSIAPRSGSLATTQDPVERSR